MRSHHLTSRLDGPLYASAGAICLLGWLVLASATARGGPLSSDALRQAVYMAAGLGVMAACLQFDPRVLSRLAAPVYVVAVLALASVAIPGIGHSSHGAQRWISLGSLGTLQPSEIAKLALVLALAALLDARGREDARRAGDWVSLLLAGAVLALPCGLIMLQPDLGTALVLVAVTLGVVFVAGCSPVWPGLCVTLGALVIPHVLKGYQRDRLLVFLDPNLDPRGLGYNLIQSKIAIGSGGLWGAGLFAGAMSQLHYVPEQRTDFIFSVIGEEFGFAGSLGFLVLYGVLLFCMLRVAWRCRDSFERLLVTGIAAMFAFHVVVNVGMTVGLLPVVGIPLPLVSYGGTAVLTDLAAIGVVGSVSARRARECSSDMVASPGSHTKAGWMATLGVATVPGLGRRGLHLARGRRLRG